MDVDSFGNFTTLRTRQAHELALLTLQGKELVQARAMLPRIRQEHMKR